MNIVTFNKRIAVNLKEEGYVKGFGEKKFKGETMPLHSSNIKRKMKTKWPIFIFFCFLITVTIQQDASSFHHRFLL